MQIQIESLVTEPLLAILLSSVVAFNQTVHKSSGSGSISPDSARELTVAVSSGAVDLMASYEAMIDRGLKTPHQAVGCAESGGRTWVSRGDEKKAILVAASNLARQNGLSLSGAEWVTPTGLHEEITERAVAGVGPVLTEGIASFATPNSTITCVLIRDLAR